MLVLNLRYGCRLKCFQFHKLRVEKLEKHIAMDTASRRRAAPRGDQILNLKSQRPGHHDMVTICEK